MSLDNLYQCSSMTTTELQGSDELHLLLLPLLTTLSEIFTTMYIKIGISLVSSNRIVKIRMDFATYMVSKVLARQVPDV